MVSALMLRDGGKKNGTDKRRKAKQEGEGTNWKSDRKTTASARDAGVVVWCNEEGNSGNPRGQERGKAARKWRGVGRKKRKQNERRSSAAQGEAKRRWEKQKGDATEKKRKRKKYKGVHAHVKTDPSGTGGCESEAKSGAANRERSVPSKEIDERRDAQPTTEAGEFGPVEPGKKREKNKRDERAEREGADSEGARGAAERCSGKVGARERERDKKQRHTREKAGGKGRGEPRGWGGIEQ
jgi:hypothetical protein